ncbi:MAG: diguanylate cyclase [Bryobacteraceae bacterium]|nr:diguanylate cyclase [Bryobacteraceae bacterium]
MKVLIADDSLVMRRLLQVTLEGWGYEVWTAADGAEAWALLQQEDAPQIAILDWIMPIFTGLEICRLVRRKQENPYIYLLLLTSKSQREDIVEGMGAGADDYVVKPFDKHELEVRLRAGRRIVELQNELLATQEALRVQATRDVLTGCWNRRAILEVLGRELPRSRREGRHLAVVLADLDNFKQVNDRWGHAAGDAVLVEAARRMESGVRPYDSLGRYGGEEFLAVLPGCDEGGAISLASRLAGNLRRDPVLYDGEPISVTGSFGVSCAPAGAQVGVDDLLRAADEALYEAKRTGRDRVIAGQVGKMQDLSGS